jgi:hypothetical protein
MFGEAIELYVPTAAGLCAATFWLGLVLADWLFDRAELLASSRAIAPQKQQQELPKKTAVELVA